MEKRRPINQKGRRRILTRNTTRTNPVLNVARRAILNPTVFQKMMATTTHPSPLNPVGLAVNGN
jgi:hypothetical protein